MVAVKAFNPAGGELNLRSSPDLNPVIAVNSALQLQSAVVHVKLPDELATLEKLSTCRKKNPIKVRNHLKSKLFGQVRLILKTYRFLHF
ncbi:uncharacterized protein isoform X2 [Danio rerio]|uniref:Uncharacterized protein isoform X2 n=2 Tax=Danio rerio TaxID=7955 RepID=A0AC58HWR5_DANRE